MFCRYCGAPLPDGAKFCGTCGKPVTSRASRPSAPKQTSQNPQAQKIPVQNFPYPDIPEQNAPYPDRTIQHSPYPEGPLQNPYQNRSSQNQSFSQNTSGAVPPSLSSVAGRLKGLVGSIAQNFGNPRPKVEKGSRIKVKKTYNIGNFICFGGCALAAASLFLPYVSVSLLGFSEDQTLIDTEDGSIFLALILVIAVVNLLRLNIGTIALSAFHLYFVYMEHDNVASSYASALSDFGMGHTLQIFGSILMLAASVAGLILWMRRKRSAGL